MIAEGFVYLSDAAPDIIQNVIYAGDNNFLGRPVKGYNTNEIVLTKEAATALIGVQNELKELGLELVVYDAYRPKKAVDDFISWSEDSSNQKMKRLYYPYLNKKNLFDLGFISKKSTHTRGSTVDLSVIERGKKVSNILIESRILSDGSNIPFLNDGTIDMGSSVDLFHEVSYHDSDLIDKTILDRRNSLRKVMEKHGFKAYSKEWWHYQLEKEPFPDTYFDFDISLKK